MQAEYGFIHDQVQVLNLTMPFIPTQLASTLGVDIDMLIAKKEKKGGKFLRRF